MLDNILQPVHDAMQAQMTKGLETGQNMTMSVSFQFSNSTSPTSAVLQPNHKLDKQVDDTIKPLMSIRQDKTESVSRTHIKAQTVAKSEGKRYPCSVCHHEGDRESRPKEHFRNWHTEKEIPQGRFKCASLSCWASFNKKWSADKHDRDFHSSPEAQVKSKIFLKKEIISIILAILTNYAMLQDDRMKKLNRIKSIYKAWARDDEEFFALVENKKELVQNNEFIKQQAQELQTIFRQKVDEMATLIKQFVQA